MLPKFVVLLCLYAMFVVSEARAQQANAAQLQRYSQEGEKALAAGRYDEAAQAYESPYYLVVLE